MTSTKLVSTEPVALQYYFPLRVLVRYDVSRSCFLSRSGRNRLCQIVFSAFPGFETFAGSTARRSLRLTSKEVREIELIGSGSATASFIRDAANCSICFANVEAFYWQKRQNAPLLQFWQGCQSPLKTANLVKVLPRQNFYFAAAVWWQFSPS